MSPCEARHYSDGGYSFKPDFCDRLQFVATAFVELPVLDCRSTQRLGKGTGGSCWTLVMHYIIRFETSKFDVAQEEHQQADSVWGQSLLLWLKDRLSGQFQLEDPGRQDWGWFTTIEWQGRTYQLCASAMEAATESAC